MKRDVNANEILSLIGPPIFGERNPVLEKESVSYVYLFFLGVLLLGHQDKAEEEGEVRATKFDPVVQEFLGIEVIGLGGLHRIQRHQLQVTFQQD